MDWAEEDWERRRPPIELALAEAASLLAALGRARALTYLPGGKSNSNYRVALEGHPDVVLRIYQRDAEALEREAALLERVHRCDAAIPAPRLLGRGRLAAGHPVGIFEWRPGVPPHRLLRDDSAGALGRACGLLLARLAALRVPAMGLYAADLSLARSFESFAESFVDLISWSLRSGRARRRLPPELRARLGARLEPLAAELAPLDAHPCLSHGDYKFSNMLARERDGQVEITALLDWEFAAPFCSMLDVAILLRHRAGFPPGFVPGFAAGFTAGGAELPPRWLRLARIVDLMNLVGFLNSPGARPRLHAAVIAHVAATLELLS